MEALKEWALSACIASVCGGLIYIISPSGSLEKVLKISLSIFFLTCLISPIILNWNNIDIEQEYIESFQNFEYEENLTQTVENQVANRFKSNLNGIIVQKLEEINVETEKIDISININEDNSISISQISIFLLNSYKEKEDRIKAKIEKDIGVKPILEYVEVK